MNGATFRPIVEVCQDKPREAQLFVQLSPLISLKTQSMDSVYWRNTLIVG